MGKIDSRLRILWLSDIHYRKGYCVSNSALKHYISSFMIFLKDKINKKYDYLLLSGDLADHGDIEDYNLLFSDLIEPIKKLFPGIRLLAIPGNHDVNRRDADFLEDFIKSLPTEKKDNIRRAFFSNNRGEFDKIFEGYSASLDNWNFIKQEISTLKNNKFLYGHTVDLKNKTVFVLLNSSWYSLGDDILKKYLNDIFDDVSKFDSYRDDIKQIILDIRNVTEEYGRQVLALNFISEIEAIVEVLKKYSDFLVITTMHHPINWLDMSDRVTDSENLFHTIKANTDLLLTGHEHVPKEHLSECINNDDVLHIQAGCFMYQQKPEDFITYNNWFSTLEINTIKRTVHQNKYYFDDIKSAWFKFKNAKVSNRKLNRVYSSKIPTGRLEELKRRFSINDLVSKGIIKSKSEKLRENYYLRKDILYIFISDIDFYNNRKDIFINIKAYMSQHNINVVDFLFFDIFHIYESEYIENSDRLVTLEKIKNDYENQFNLLRHNFFSKLNIREAKQYSELKFVSTIVPYWRLENYISS